MNLSEVVQNLGKLQAGKVITRSALRNPLLALAAGGLYLGYKMWKGRSPSVGTTTTEATKPKMAS